MQSMQRQFGKFMKRSADDSQVAVLMKDFEEADKLLGRIVDSIKSWRDAWSSILAYQCRMVTEFNGLYAPIVGTSEPTSNRKPAETPELALARTSSLRNEYEDLQTDLMQELDAMEQRMIQPAMQAKEFLAPMKKTIKKREDRKLDYERYQSRADSYSKKAKRSDRDNSSLAKAEMDFAKATEDYNAADETLKQRLPPLISTVFSLLPRLLATQIEIQNTMLATYYTILYNYAQQHQFPNPAPEMDQIVQSWDEAFSPIQQETETFQCLQRRSSRQTGNGADNALSNFRRRSSNNNYALPPAPQHQQLSKSPSPSAPPLQEPEPRKSPIPTFDPKPYLNGSSLANTPSAGDCYQPTRTPSASLTPSAISSSSTTTTPLSFSPAAPKTDYFTRDRQPAAAEYMAAAVAKKKPPPPPPRPGPGAQYVTALYDFGGQSEGDLAFRERDRIRVVEKTDSTDDWWEGELRGVRGSFPANYVE